MLSHDPGETLPSVAGIDLALDEALDHGDHLGAHAPAGAGSQDVAEIGELDALLPRRGVVPDQSRGSRPEPVMTWRR